MAILISNGSATGGAVYIGRGGDHIYSVTGTFGGATVALQMLLSNNTWLTIDDTGLTAAGALVVTLPENATVKATVTGGSPSGLYVEVC